LLRDLVAHRDDVRLVLIYEVRQRLVLAVPLLVDRLLQIEV